MSTEPIRIYRLSNKLNGSAYVGQTVQTLEARFSQHARCKKDLIIVRALKKYGKENFSILLLGEYQDQNQANLAEQYYIEFYNTMAPNGYNATPGGRVALPGWKHTDEAKKKISAAGMGRTYKHTVEAKQKMSKSKKGRTPWNKGKKLSHEHILKLSASHKGQKSSRKGIAWSAEERLMISKRTREGMKRAGYGIK